MDEQTTTTIYANRDLRHAVKSLLSSLSFAAPEMRETLVYHYLEDFWMTPEVYTKIREQAKRIKELEYKLFESIESEESKSCE